MLNIKEFHITLIEKNPHLGGKLNVLEQDGFSFDLGPSIFTMPQYFDALFEMHGKKRKLFQTRTCDTTLEKLFEDGTTIDLADTLEGMKALDNITEKKII